MKALTEKGKQYVADIAAKYNLRTESVDALLRAVVSGNGTMAQFNIAELGGSGQWMKGGMTMVGDMFNNTLKGTVDQVCNELAGLVTTQILYEESGELPTLEHPSSQSEESVHLSLSSTSWPSVFGNPSSSGSQNNFRYAYFAPVRRLVIDENGQRSIYDTKHHQITGISQQQGQGSSYKFTSQNGLIDLGSLSLISEPSAQMQSTPEIPYDVTSTADLEPVGEGPDRSPQDIIIATIEKVNVLFEKGQISEEEFKAKKQELLSKL